LSPKLKAQKQCTKGQDRVAVGDLHLVRGSGRAVVVTRLFLLVQGGEEGRFGAEEVGGQSLAELGQVEHGSELRPEGQVTVSVPLTATSRGLLGRL